MPQPLCYAINVSFDGCCTHEAGLPPDAEFMSFWTDELLRSDTLLYGRVTYEMLRETWRRPESGVWPDWMGGDDHLFGDVIDAMPRVVASATLNEVD